MSMPTTATPPARPEGKYWTIRLLRPDEDVVMADLSRACFGARGDSLDFIRARYTHSTGPRVGVVIGDAGGQICGTQAVTFIPGFAAGREITIGMFTAGMTHPDHRKRGVFRDVVASAERYAWEQGADCLFTMPNDESFPSFQRFPGWLCLADRPLLAMPLRFGRFLGDRGLPRWLSGPVGFLTDGVLTRRFSTPPATVIELDDLEPLVSAFDQLAEHEGRRRGGIICRRDSAFLRWRFLENPTFKYRVFVARNSDGIEGYLVTTIERRMRTTLAHVVDWLAIPAPGALEGLIAAGARAAREDGATLIAVIATSGARVEPFRAFGFRRVPRRLVGRGFHTAVAINPSRTDLVELGSSDEGWHLTLGDFDTI